MADSFVGFYESGGGFYESPYTMGSLFGVNKSAFATGIGFNLNDAGEIGGSLYVQVGLWEKASGNLLATASRSIPISGSTFTGHVGVNFEKTVKLTVGTTYAIGAFISGGRARYDGSFAPETMSVTRDGILFSIDRSVFSKESGFHMPDDRNPTMNNKINIGLYYTLNVPPTINLISPPENILGISGNCEDVSQWKRITTGGDASGVISLDAANKLYSNYAFKVQVPANLTSEGIFKQVQMSRQSYYLLMADIKTVNASELRLRHFNGTVYSDKSVTSSSYTTPYIKINKDQVGATDNWVSVSVHGAAGQYGFVDGIRLYEIAKDVYDKIDVDPEYTGDKLAKKYPFTDPTTYQTLTEGNAMVVQGSATDTDANDPVTIYLQINNGTILAVDSKVSDGATAIPFAKTLTYKNKRVYSGTTDIVDVDLAENADHILKVWAEDNKQGKSLEVTRKFRVVWNRPPVIDGENRDLGIMNTPPSVKYTVTDPESNPFTVTEKINGVVIRTFPGVSGRQETITIPHEKWLLLEPGILHKLTIEATDDQGMMSTREFTLTRFADKIIWMMDFGTMESATKEFFTTDVAAKRLLLTPVWNLPPGANLLVEVCNNAYDAAPTWEDATIVVKLNRAHLFNNTTKTAAKWGINFRFRIEKGTANLPVYFKGIGGAFD